MDLATRLRYLRDAAVARGDFNLARELELEMGRRGIPHAVETAITHQTLQTATPPRPRGRPRKTPVKET